MADEIGYPQSSDHSLPYDITNAVDKSLIDRELRQWITEDKQAHLPYIQEWDNVEKRLTTAFQPVGWNTDVIEQLRMANDPTVSAAQRANNKTFVSVNRTRPNHESTLGDFLSLSRKLSITATNPQDRNRARVMQRVVEYIEKKYMLPIRIYFPMMDNAWSKGLHWVKLKWNPAKRALKGMFEPEEVSCRDVFVDNQARGAFFHSMRRVHQRFKMDVEDAKKVMKRYPMCNLDAITSDPAEYEETWQGSKPSTVRVSRNEATFFYTEFKQTECRYYYVDPLKGGDPKEVSSAMYQQLLSNPETAAYSFEEEEEAYYIALSDLRQGCFHLQYNPFGMFLLIPLVNVESSDRLYPMGDVQIYANLQDLLDVLVNVFLENAKRANIPIADVDKEYWEDDEAQELINSVLKHGGAAPGIKNIFNGQVINSYLTQLIPWTMGWIQDTVSKHSATMGELPAKQIAKETVQALMAKDRTAQGRKDICIAYTLTQLARGIVKMAAKFMNEPDYVQVTDMRPGHAGYIPINQTWKEAEYVTNLAAIFGLQVPKPPDMAKIPQANQQMAQAQYEQQSLQFEQQMYQARLKFENENQVDETVEDGVIIRNGEDAQEFRLTEISQMIQAAGLTPEEFAAKYNPEPAKVRVYIVNTLNEDLDLDILYQIDSDFQNNPEFKQNRAFQLKTMGGLSWQDFYKEIDMPNGEELAKNAMDENQALVLAKEISADPAIYQQVMAIVNGLAKAVAIPQNGKEKASAAG